jgi:hypothetical protein
MKEVDNLKKTNSIVWGLSIVGGIITTWIGVFRGVCIYDCVYNGYNSPQYDASPTLIAYGISMLLLSTLFAQVIYLFAAHVKASHKV